MKKQVKKFACVLLLCLFLLFLMTAISTASPELCSVRLKCIYPATDGQIPLKGDTYALVRIADSEIQKDGTIKSLKIADAFLPCDCDWFSLTASELSEKAKTLTEVAKKRTTESVLQTTGDNGEALFSNLSPGLYLIYRAEVNEDNKDYESDSILLTLPLVLTDGMKTDVTVSIKYAYIGHHDVPLAGQLIYPIPILIAVGLICFIIGGVFSRKKKGENP